MTPLTIKISPAGVVNLSQKSTTAGVPYLYGLSLVSAKGEQTSPTHGNVITRYTDGTLAIFDFNIAGDDLTIIATVKAGSNPLSNLAFRSLWFDFWFDFAAPPTGTLASRNFYNLQATGTALYHPSEQQPLGCTTATDGKTGLAVWLPSEVGAQSLCNATWTNDITLPQSFALEFFTTRSVAPGASYDIVAKIRLTEDLSTAGLLGGYKSILPGRNCVQQHLTGAVKMDSVDPRWVTPTNTLGYNGDNRRLDKEEGCKAYVSDFGHAAGPNVIYLFWSTGGYGPENKIGGNWYPVNHEVGLRRVLSTFTPITVKALKDAGSRVGCLARFADNVNAAGTIYKADPNSVSDIKSMIDRLDMGNSCGINAYYVDDSGGDWNSIKLIQLARQHDGPSVPFFTEYTTDVTLSVADVYCEWTGTQTHWLSELQRSHLQYLYPEATWLCVDRTGLLTATQIRKLGFVPLVEDAAIASLNS